MYRVILKKTDFQQILLPYFLFYSLASLPGKNSCTKSYSFWQQIFCGSGTSSNPVNTGKHLHETCMYLSYSYMYAFWLKYLSQLREVQILRQFIRYMLHFLIFKYTCSMWSKCQWAKFKGEIIFFIKQQISCVWVLKKKTSLKQKYVL